MFRFLILGLGINEWKHIKTVINEVIKSENYLKCNNIGVFRETLFFIEGAQLEVKLIGHYVILMFQFREN